MEQEREGLLQKVRQLEEERAAHAAAAAEAEAMRAAAAARAVELEAHLRQTVPNRRQELIRLQEVSLKAAKAAAADLQRLDPERSAVAATAWVELSAPLWYSKCLN